MNEDAITRYITEAFEGVEVAVASGSSFFFYDPDQRFPFATIVTGDNEFDHLSHLDRPSVFRLNIGVSGDTYRQLFPGKSGEEEQDFAALDRLLPHPVYGRMFWVCVLNPSEETFRSVQPLLAEGYALSVAKYGKGARAE